MAFNSNDLMAIFDPQGIGQGLKVERIVSNGTGLKSVFVTGNAYPYQGIGKWVDVAETATPQAAASAILAAVNGLPSVVFNITNNLIGISRIRPNDAYTTGSSGIKTDHCKYEADAPFVAVRLVYVHKNTSGTLPTIEALVGATETMARDTISNCYLPTKNGVAYNSMAAGPGQPGWFRVTFGGANIGNPVMNTITSNGCTYLISDRIPLTSLPRTDVVGGRPALVFRVANTLTGAAWTSGLNAMASTYTTDRGNIQYREALNYGVTNDGVNTLTNLPPGVSTSIGFEIACFPVFEYASPVRGVIVTGDSRKSSANNPWGTSWELHALRGITNNPQPISVGDFAGSGHSQDQYLKLVTDFIAGGGSMSDLIMPAFSQNGFSTAATFISKNRAVIDQVRALGVNVWLDTDYAVNGYTTGEAQRQLCIAEARNLLAQGIVKGLIDIDAVITDYTHTPYPIINTAYDSGDGVHTSGAAQTTYQEPVLKNTFI